MKQLYILLLLMLASSLSYGQAVVSGTVKRTNGDSVQGARIYIRADSSSGQPVFQTVTDTSTFNGSFAISLPSGIPNGTVFYVATLNCDSLSEVSNTHVYTGSNINSPLVICVTPVTNFSGYVFLEDSSKRPQPGEAEVHLIAKCAGNVLINIDTVLTDTNGYYSVDTFPRLASGCQLVMKAQLKTTSPDYKKYLPSYHEDNSSYRLRWTGARDIPYNVAQSGVDFFLPEAINPFGGPSLITGYAVSDQATVLPGKVIFILDNVNIPVDFAYTDAQGYFSFSNIPFGSYRLFGDVWGKDNPDLSVKVDADNVNIHHIIFTENSTEFKGRIAVSTVDISAGMPEMTAFPNPATDMIYLRGSENIHLDKQVTVKDIAGRIVYAKQAAAREQISVSVKHLPGGVYLLHVQAGDAVATYKIIKQSDN